MPLRLLCFFRAMRSQIAKRRSSNEASVSYEGRGSNWKWIGEQKQKIRGNQQNLSRIKIIQLSSHQIHPNTASATKSDTPTSPTPCFFSILHSFSVSFPSFPTSFPSSLHQWSCLKVSSPMFPASVGKPLVCNQLRNSCGLHLAHRCCWPNNTELDCFISMPCKNATLLASKYISTPADHS